MYIVVAIVLISTGFSVYYVVRNDEEIYSAVAQGSSFYINQGETLEIPVVRENPASYTEFTLKSGNYNYYLDVDLEAWTITGKCGGNIRLEFVSTNKKYEDESFTVDIKIGNGTEANPYYIRNEQDILNIGKDQYKLSDSYKVVNDITMTTSMMPIGVKIEDGKLSITEFTGTITGEKRQKISNVNVKVEGNSTPNSSGFFAVLGGNAKVENLIFENITVEGYHKYVGTIAGTNYGLIGKCEVKNGSVTNTYYKGFTGGIVGLNISENDNAAQVNICSADVSINSKWVAGGIAGKNVGGVIYNCLIKTNNLNLNVDNGVDAKYSYFGGIAGLSICGEEDGKTYDSYVANCLAYIYNVKSSSHIAGVFGAYYGKSEVYESEGNYKMLLYVAETELKPYYLCDDEVEISDKNNNTANNYAKQITNNDALASKSPYTSINGSNWDFENVWLIVEDESISLNLDKTGLEYQAFTQNGGVFTIDSSKKFKEAVNQMRSQPSKNCIYEFTSSVTYEGNDESWEPIGTKEEPFKGQIKMAEGVTVTINKVVIDAEYAGLFGVVSGNNTIIENIILKDAEISGTMVGGIAAFNDGATIKNCQVQVTQNNTFTTNKYVGAIVGYNTGVIENCLVCTELSGETTEYKATGYDLEIELNSDIKNGIFYIGGITGKNSGKISNVFVSSIYVSGFSVSDDNRTIFLGGAAGVNTGNISEVTVNTGVTVDGSDYNTSTAWIGGLVGSHDEGTIESSVVTKENGSDYIPTFKFSSINENVVAGGLAGYVDGDAKISGCVVDYVQIDAFSVGGFAGACDGKIDQSYVSNNCVLTGAYVGGFTASLRGNVEDCVTAASLQGTKIVAGMTVYLRKGSSINCCYIDVSFNKDSTGEVYAETSSEFKRNPNAFGSITNTIIVADEDNEYFLLKGPFTGTTYLRGLSVKINGVKAKLQVRFHVAGFNYLPVIVEYRSLCGNYDNILCDYGFVESNWTFKDPLMDSAEMALPVKAAEVLKIDIAKKHSSETAN